MGGSRDSRGTSAHEIRYSKMLKWIIDPYENHGLKHYFVREFVHRSAKNCNRQAFTRILIRLFRILA